MAWWLIYFLEQFSLISLAHEPNKDTMKKLIKLYWKTAVLNKLTLTEV